MATIDVIAAHSHSSRHRDEIARSDTVGCFYCLDTYPPSEVVEWLDNEGTALCPRCGIDSVIGDASGLPATDPAFLSAMRDHWFAQSPQL